MNVTAVGVKYSQLRFDMSGQITGGSSQKDSAEHERYARAYDSTRITENNATDANKPEMGLLEEIVSGENIKKAAQQVISNKGTYGIDWMTVGDVLQYLERNGDQLKQSILDGKYKPNPVRRVEIPKEDGKKRSLGIPTVIDRVIQQAIAQVLTPIYEEQFSENSYGFRPGRSAHDAIRSCVDNINEGYVYVVDMDLEKFFDTVNQSKLVEVVSRTIKDGRVISLIHRYLRAGVIVENSYKDTEVGVPQGGPLSPLLSNIILNELDKELEKRGHRFVRYADDVVILCRSKRAAERTLENTVNYIEKKLFLSVNKEKTVVDKVNRVKFLGFSFYFSRGKAKVRLHPKTIIKMREKVKELTSRKHGMNTKDRTEKLRKYIVGWVNYFKIADMKKLLIATDGWMRRRIRMVFWKQWKRVKTRYRKLVSFGIPKQDAIRFANTRKSYWRTAGSQIMSKSLTNKAIQELGFLYFSDHYRQVAA